MKHRNGVSKLGRNGQHRRALLRNLAAELFDHERIVTTLGKAKALRPFAEHLISIARAGDLSARRRVARDVARHGVLQKLFAEVAPRYVDRPGGYTRIVKMGPRRGDNAPVALIELVKAAPVSEATAAPAADGAAPATSADSQDPAASP